MRFSIVIPIYNSEKFLKKSIESIFEQTEKDWELLLINDGSNDKSLDICREYEMTDDRVVLISKMNEGVSKTRNLGISRAQGEYIIFLDADDMLISNALQIISGKIDRFDPDIVSYHTLRTNEEMEIISPFTICKYEKEKIVRNAEDFCADIYRELIQGSNLGIIGNYAVRRSLIKDISFDSEMVMCEDWLFNMQMFEKATSVVFIPDYLYLYRDNSNGCVRNYNLKKIENKKRVVKEKIALAERNGVSYDIEKIYNWFCSDLIYDYWNIVGNLDLEKNFLDCIHHDQEIMDMYRKLKRTQNLRLSHPDFRYIVGNKVERFFLRQFLLIKKSVKSVMRK